MAKITYGGYTGPVMPIQQGGLGIAGATPGRVSSPSSYIAPTQAAYGNVYKAASKNAQRNNGGILNVTGMTIQPGEVAGQYAGLLPDAKQYWIDYYNKKMQRRGQDYFQKGRFKGMGAPTFASGEEFADWMSGQVMRQPLLRV